MSQHSLIVSITSIAEPLFSGEADSITVPGVSGEMTILAHHEALITTLKPGTVTVRVNGEKKQFNVTHGVLEVSNNTANVLL
jgi:F-type H+-transporting ATPase subunit epsilon